MHVKWTSVSGRCQISELPLSECSLASIGSSTTHPSRCCTSLAAPLTTLDDLRGVHKRLVTRVFHNEQPAQASQGSSPGQLGLFSTSSAREGVEHEPSASTLQHTSPMYLRFSTGQACLK